MCCMHIPSLKAFASIELQLAREKQIFKIVTGGRKLGAGVDHASTCVAARPEETFCRPVSYV